MIAGYCPSGEEKINGLCVPCKKGFYKNNGVNGLFAACKPCDALYTTSGTGSDDVSDCNISMFIFFQQSVRVVQYKEK